MNLISRCLLYFGVIIIALVILFIFLLIYLSIRDGRKSMIPFCEARKQKRNKHFFAKNFACGNFAQIFNEKFKLKPASNLIDFYLSDEIKRIDFYIKIGNEYCYIEKYSPIAESSESYFVLARDGMGNFYIIYPDIPSYPVYFIDHEDNFSKPIKLTECLEDFINAKKYIYE